MGKEVANMPELTLPAEPAEAETHEAENEAVNKGGKETNDAEE